LGKVLGAVRSITAKYLLKLAGGRQALVLANFLRLTLDLWSSKSKLAQLGCTRLDQVVDYFRNKIFHDENNYWVPFSKAELIDMYEQIQPIFWHDRRDLAFLNRITTTE